MRHARLLVFALLTLLYFGTMTHLAVAQPPEALNSGDRSETVRTAQYLLRARGYKLQADGIFGKTTSAQVQAFQRAKKLSATGTIDKRTWHALIVKVNPESRGDAVRAVQSKLKTLSYRVTVDGVYGTQTGVAVKRFQRNHGLAQDGVVGPKTWDALWEAIGDEVSVEGSGGSIRPAMGKSSDWKLLNEQVAFDIYDGEYEATTTAVLENPGGIPTVILAIPEIVTDPDPNYSPPGESSFRSFVMRIDGRTVPAKRVYVKGQMGGQGDRAEWQHSVTLQRGQKIKVQAQWRAKHTNSYVGTWVAYDFVGKQWSGSPATSFTATFHRPGMAYSLDIDFAMTRVLTADIAPPNLPAARIQGNRCHYQWNGDVWNKRFTLNFSPTVPGWLDGDSNNLSVTVPGKIDWTSNVDETGYIWLPDALLRDGRAFVALEILDKRIEPPVPSPAKDWRTLNWERNDTIATLEAGGHRLRFESGQSKMQVDGKRWVDLPAAPFKLSASHPHDGPYTWLYVPLAPLLKELGGTVELDVAKNHIIYSGPWLSEKAEDPTKE